MKLISVDVRFMESLYCPSTNETIFGPGPNWKSDPGIAGLENVPLYRVPDYYNWDLRDIKYDASAFIGCWHDNSDVPIIKDEHLKNAWVEEWGDEFPGDDHCLNFLKQYNNPDWIALKCNFYDELNQDVSLFRIYVVKADCYIYSPEMN